MYLVYKFEFPDTIKVVGEGSDPQILQRTAINFIKHEHGAVRAAQPFTLEQASTPNAAPGFYLVQDPATPTHISIYNRVMNHTQGWLYSTVDWTVTKIGHFGLLYTAAATSAATVRTVTRSTSINNIHVSHRPFLTELTRVISEYVPKTPEQIQDFIAKRGSRDPEGPDAAQSAAPARAFPKDKLQSRRRLRARHPRVLRQLQGVLLLFKRNQSLHLSPVQIHNWSNWRPIACWSQTKRNHL